MDFSAKDIEWIFSGIGVVALTGLWAILRRGRNTDSARSQPINQTININPQVPVPISESEEPRSGPITRAGTSILFIDDDTKFQVVNILKKDGWTNTKIIKDVVSLDQPEVAGAEILFVDIRGVGRSMQFKEEGLGLVVALKSRYPNKKVVIYSAEPGHNSFHAAWGAADARISKDADPYEFIELLQSFVAKR